MRIIAGKFKGHKLASFDEDHIRPTTDRVKESVFNILLNTWPSHLVGARVLDLYSGTGSLGLECLSRDAQSVDMVEINGRSIKIIQKNTTLLQVKDQVHIHKSDVLAYLKKYEGGPFNLIVIDPPFPSQICLKTLIALDLSPACDAESLIVIEHSSHEPLEDVIGSLERVDSRSYGDKIASFYKRKST